MKNTLIVLTILNCLACTKSQNAKYLSSYQTIGTIEKLDDAFDKIITKGAKAEIIAKGFEWSEGPLWIEKHHMLLFSDVPGNIVYKVGRAARWT